MTSPRFRSQRLEATRDVDGFTCGNEALDQWLHQHAATAQAKRTSVTYVWTTADGTVAAYYSLAPHLIENADLPRRLRHGDPRQIPAILLARLALSGELRGTGLGGILLHDALSRAVAASQQAGGRYVVVDAIDNNARQFYEHYGFTPCRDQTAWSARSATSKPTSRRPDPQRPRAKIIILNGWLFQTNPIITARGAGRRHGHAGGGCPFPIDPGI